MLIGLLLLAIGLGGGGITWKWLEAATNFHDASTNLAKAEAETLRFRKKSYVSDMKLAWQAWDEGRIGRVQQLLESHRPPPEQEDVPAVRVVLPGAGESCSSASRCAATRGR